MLAMRVLFCSSLFKVCSCISEPLMLAVRVLFFSYLRNVSSVDSKAFCVSYMHAKMFSIQMLLYTFQSNCAEGLHFSAFHYLCNNYNSFWKRMRTLRGKLYILVLIKAQVSYYYYNNYYRVYRLNDI